MQAVLCGHLVCVCCHLTRQEGQPAEQRLTNTSIHVGVLRCRKTVAGRGALAIRACCDAGRALHVVDGGVDCSHIIGHCGQEVGSLHAKVCSSKLGRTTCIVTGMMADVGEQNHIERMQHQLHRYPHTCSSLDGLRQRLQERLDCRLKCASVVARTRSAEVGVDGRGGIHHLASIKGTAEDA